MKTKLLSQLREEAEEYFEIQNVGYAVCTIVLERGLIIKAFFGIFRKEQAKAYCEEKIREYILRRVSQIKKKNIKKLLKIW